MKPSELKIMIKEAVSDAVIEVLTELMAVQQPQYNRPSNLRETLSSMFQPQQQYQQPYYQQPPAPKAPSPAALDMRSKLNSLFESSYQQSAPTYPPQQQYQQPPAPKPTAANPNLSAILGGMGNGINMSDLSNFGFNPNDVVD